MQNDLNLIFVLVGLVTCVTRLKARTLEKQKSRCYPIINFNPNDMTCIFSTLNFITEQAKQLEIVTPVVTFDQPLWLKSAEIMAAKSMKIINILGGFHMIISFLGSMAEVMKGSGLSEALETIYGTNTVVHIMSGKAIARAIRGHFLIETALVTKLLSKLEASTLQQITDILPDIEQALQNSYEDGLIELESSKIFNQASSQLSHIKQWLSEISRTAKLWVQYLQYISILKHFIRAERTDNWNLHVVTVGQMLNLFAATGHINYAKSARLYVQNMQKLHVEYPWIYRNFAVNGYHTVCRSDSYWSGIWTDLIIEQLMVRSLKTSGGIIRGRGATESIRQLWIGSMHRTASAHDAISNLTRAYRKTSEQHINLSTSRVNRDDNDYKEVLNCFNEHDPFNQDQSLKNLSTGLVANESDKINCDTAELVGYNIQLSFDNNTMSTAKIKRGENFRTLQDLP